MTVLCQLRNNSFFCGSVASSINPEVFNLELKNRISQFSIFFSWKNREKCNSNNFQNVEKILRISVDNLFLQIPLKFQVDRIIIVWVLLDF